MRTCLFFERERERDVVGYIEREQTYRILRSMGGVVGVAEDVKRMHSGRDVRIACLAIILRYLSILWGICGVSVVVKFTIGILVVVGRRSKISFLKFDWSKLGTSFCRIHPPSR